MIAQIYTQGLGAVLQTFSLRRHGNLESVSCGHSAEEVTRELASTATQTQMTSADFFAFMQPEACYQWAEVPWVLAATGPTDAASRGIVGAALSRAADGPAGHYRLYLRPIVVSKRV